ncbi:ANTAR domain-containing protein [Streptomyces glaucus]|uniref:ANTAR domain-containing protein n=1 Tax=Streptomyces glaucus TaxID=284029 RepID=A0ABN3K968_9ACTN
MTSAAPSLAGRLNTLVIDSHVDADQARLVPRGELVHGCTDVLAGTLGRLPAGVRRVDLDMGGVVFMDTAGLQFLDVLGDYGRRRSVPVTATNWNGQPRRILELAGLDTTDPLRCAARRAAPDTDHGPGPAAPDTGHGPGPAASALSAVARERAERLLRLQELQQEVEQLRQAITSRPVIDQARGILMAVHGCTSDEAWHILREASQLSNTKLRRVAEAVTASAVATAPPPPPALRRALRTAISRLRA